MNNSKYLFLFMFILSAHSFAQYNVGSFSVGINGVYTTSAEIFLNPNSSDPFLKNNSFELDDIFNPSIDIRYRLNNQVLFGLNVGYMKKTETAPNLTVFIGSSTATIDVEEGFVLIPVELSVYYMLPFSTERFLFQMGGGVGFYYGSRIRNFGDAEVSNAERDFAYGIQVAASVDYVIVKNFSVRFEMKFRDPQFSLKSRYNKTLVNYQGTQVTLANDTFDSKVNVNGVTFIAALVIHL